MLVRAYAYVFAHGGDGLKAVSERAALNANYLAVADRRGLPARVPGRRPMHEFVATARGLKDATGVRAMDVAKRLIDLGYHPSTVYFPLVVEEAMMVEPTETETKETLEAFADALLQAAAEAAHRPRAPARGARHHAGPPPGRGARGAPPEAAMGTRGSDDRTEPIARSAQDEPFAYLVTKDGARPHRSWRNDGRRDHRRDAGYSIGRRARRPPTTTASSSSSRGRRATSPPGERAWPGRGRAVPFELECHNVRYRGTVLIGPRRQGRCSEPRLRVPRA